MSRARVYVSSMAHTPPSQLLARARLLAKRRSLALLARIAPVERSLHGRAGPALREVLPPPVFPPRLEQSGFRDGRPVARFLGIEREVASPIGWEARDWPEGTHLQRLALHYMEWCEGLEDTAFVAAVDDWIARVRPYRPGYWLTAWNSYALSIRCVVWLQQLALRRARLAPSFVARCAESIVAQIRFLRGNLETDIRGNHLVRNVKALLWAGAAFEGPEADAWRSLGVRLLLDELDAQVLPDGVHYERSPAYHAQVLGDFLECAAVVPAGAARERLAADLDAMARALAALTHPDGGVALFNDGGIHMAYAPVLLLDACERPTGRRPSPSASVALPAAGFYGARAAGDLVLVKAGRIGDDGLPAHAHGDVFSFEWSVEGRRLVVDAGVFEYEEGPMRAWSRATSTHNTVTVADADQAEFWKSFRVGRRPNVRATYAPSSGGCVVEGEHDGFRHLAGAPIHRRRFEVTPAAIAVADRVDAGAGQPVRARILLHPDATIEQFAGGATISCGPARARLTTASPISVVTAWWCPDFGVKLGTLQVVLEYGAAPCSGSFRLEKI